MVVNRLIRQHGDISGTHIKGVYRVPASHQWRSSGTRRASANTQKIGTLPQNWAALSRRVLFAFATLARAAVL
jgi:hypothetical protein